jgi:hypothetical protein
LARKKKKKNKSRKAAKPQRQSASAESHIERTTISLRLCAFARIKKEKIIGAQSRQAAKSAAADRRTGRHCEN